VSESIIELRGVRVHNLKGIDLDLPQRKFIVICGRSGSGKTSLAIDTLYAEGQRRYLECFSAYTRQFLARLEKPDAESIRGIPAAIAVTQTAIKRANEGTVASATDVLDLLQVVMASAGEIVCPSCQRKVVATQPNQVIESLTPIAAGKKLLIGFSARTDRRAQPEQIQNWRAQGFVRLVVGERILTLDQFQGSEANSESPLVIVDRLVSGKIDIPRLTESVATAYRFGHGMCEVLVEVAEEPESLNIDGGHWRRLPFCERLQCPSCATDFAPLEPKGLSYRSPLGACPNCEGRGQVTQTFPDQTKPPRGKRARENTRETCRHCQGTRLNPAALAVRLAGRNTAEWTWRTAEQLRDELPAALSSSTKVAGVLNQIIARLDYLVQVGIGYLTLDRPLSKLSRGEAQRVALTSALSSSLVHMLYVLDEPTVGMHPADTENVLVAIRKLRDRGNTVVAVEHDPALLQTADEVVELGPEAGQRGGEIIFQGSPTDLLNCETSRTGDYLAGRLGGSEERTRREPKHGWLKLVGARGNNLKNVTVELPLGVLCVVTGVSGAGKSSLIEETLYPSLRAKLNQETSANPLAHDDLVGAGQLENVVFVDGAPIGRSPRSNPVTYIKAFDEIRQVFAQTVDAKVNNFTVGHFSFNGAAGRCSHCEGDGAIKVDMQFLPDVFMRCPACHGARYRKELLAVKYRGRSIAEVLELTVREAFLFFRGQKKVQAKLKRLMDVGLDYLQLGQGAHTLSGGEAQRMKLAGYLQTARRGRTLFLLEEPTAGLHFQDVTQLLDCFDSLLAVGHSLIVIEHNLQVIYAADYVIDLGPGAAEQGGQIVAHGTPEEIAAIPASRTGAALRD
jgi:excinuclease ABC subunit A